jgi:hypothetical protein
LELIFDTQELFMRLIILIALSIIYFTPASAEIWICDATNVSYVSKEKAETKNTKGKVTLSTEDKSLKFKFGDRKTQTEALLRNDFLILKTENWWFEKQLGQAMMITRQSLDPIAPFPPVTVQFFDCK